jgi:hypothetical protein
MFKSGSKWPSHRHGFSLETWSGEAPIVGPLNIVAKKMMLARREVNLRGHTLRGVMSALVITNRCFIGFAGPQ